MYKTKKDYAKYHEDQLGQPLHPINPFQEFKDIELEIAKHDHYYKKKGQQTFGRERDEDKPGFYNDPLMENWQYQEIYDKSRVQDADLMLMKLR